MFYRDMKIKKSLEGEHSTRDFSYTFSIFYLKRLSFFLRFTLN